MNYDKSFLRLIKTIAALNLLLFIMANLTLVVAGYGITMKESISIKTLITFASMFLCLYLGILLLSLWVYITWMKIEESIKGKVTAGREFWGVLKVLKAYPLPIAFIALMYMVIIPITFGVIHYIWVKIGIIK